MKGLLTFLFIASSFIAMDKPKCFYAHIKFKALIQTCKQSQTKMDGRVFADSGQRERCVLYYYKKFVIDCKKEEKNSNWRPTQTELLVMASTLPL